MDGSLPKFYEFFAGGGMVRAGLGSKWECLFANDIDAVKSVSYLNNWGAESLVVADINSIKTDQLPDARADLAWASFPCQDLSVAGNMRGMGASTRSGVFWSFWRVISSLAAAGREPWIIGLENVVGWLKARNGLDFAGVCEMMSIEGYQIGAVLLDASWFLPQSRPRVFLIGVHRDLKIPTWMRLPGPDDAWHASPVIDAWKSLSPIAQQRWVWWRVQRPMGPGVKFENIMEDVPDGQGWDSLDKTSHILSLMDKVNLAKIESAKASGSRVFGTLYRRVRTDKAGIRSQRAEVRFDGLAGCLRTPSGGSSRQGMLAVHGTKVRSRLITSREAARLMGLPDSYRLPLRINDAYHLLGDGVAVPVVRHLAERIFEPLLSGRLRLDDGFVSEHNRKKLIASLDI